MSPLRHLLSYSVLCIFLIFFFSSGLVSQTVLPLAESISDFFPAAAKNAFPDFSQYNALRTLAKDEYPIDSRHKRVITVGDIHGSFKPFQTLLNKLSYKPDFDTLIHVGDIIAKGTHEGSLAVLSYMASHNVTGVRGNHDQKVIEWRAWIEWIRELDGGARWLAEADERAGLQHPTAIREEVQDQWIEEVLSGSGKWKKKIPKGWKMFSDHYKIARDMTQKQYDYLLSLPLVLHVPSAHTYIVHAGLLPYDPTRDQTHRRQPLSHVPAPFDTLSKFKGLTHTNIKGTKNDIERMRLLQELALLHDIPQNMDPWVVLNMRSVKKNNKVTTSSKNGAPYSELWNAAMGRCGGFGIDIWGDDYNSESKNKGKGKDSLPCRPSTVVYGHAAARGLDIKRWTFGTDSGCVYGRRLSALVLGSESSSSFDEIDEDSDDLNLQNIPYGDDGRGQIVSVQCH